MPKSRRPTSERGAEKRCGLRVEQAGNLAIDLQPSCTDSHRQLVCSVGVVGGYGEIEAHRDCLWRVYLEARSRLDILLPVFEHIFDYGLSCSMRHQGGEGSTALVPHRSRPHRQPSELSTSSSSRRGPVDQWGERIQRVDADGFGGQQGHDRMPVVCAGDGVDFGEFGVGASLEQQRWWGTAQRQPW